MRACCVLAGWYQRVQLELCRVPAVGYVCQQCQQFDLFGVREHVRLQKHGRRCESTSGRWVLCVPATFDCV
jgi:hypothetical protein